MRTALPYVLIALTLAGCSERSEPTAKPATSATPATVDAPLARGDIDLDLSLAQPLAYQVRGDSVVAMVRVVNRGKATIASAGKYPVDLGVVILGTDGTARTPPGRQDFVRVRLPHALAPSEALDVAIRFPVAPTLGGTVVVDAVQERVAWFQRYGKPVLTLGRLQRCGADPHTACAADGVPLATAP